MSDPVADALLETMRAQRPDDDLRYEVEPTPMTGGYFAAILQFRLASPPDDLRGDLVARIIPIPEVWARESAIQAYVAGAGFPTPAVRMSVDATSPLGRGLIVMDRATGSSPLSGLGPADIFRQLPSIVAGLPRTLARVSERLHSLDPSPLDAALDDVGGDLPRTPREFVERLADNATGTGHHFLAEAAEGLADTEPPMSAPVVCHGDLHPFNLLVDGDRVMLIDWTNSRIADPTFDLAFTHLMLTEMPVDVPKVARVALGPVARSLGRRFLREYTALRGSPIDQPAFDWHRRVHALRILVEVAGLTTVGPRSDDHPFMAMAPKMRTVLGLG